MSFSNANDLPNFRSLSANDIQKSFPRSEDDCFPLRHSPELFFQDSIFTVPGQVETGFPGDKPVFRSLGPVGGSDGGVCGLQPWGSNAHLGAFKKLSLEDGSAKRSQFVLPTAVTTKSAVKTELQVRLQEVPSFIQKHTSFEVASLPPLCLLDLIHTQLQCALSDCQVNRSKCKIKAVVHDTPTSSAKFRVCLYRRGDNGAVVAEFFRRGGCVLAFNRLYQKVLDGMAPHLAPQARKRKDDGLQMEGSSSPTKKPREADCFRPLPPPPLLSPPPSLDHLKTTLMHMVDMSGSRFVDQQLEGATALVSLLNENDNTELLCSDSGLRTSLLATVCVLLCSGLDDIVHCGSLALERLLTPSEAGREQQNTDEGSRKSYRLPCLAPGSMAGGGSSSPSLLGAKATNTCSSSLSSGWCGTDRAICSQAKDAPPSAADIRPQEQDSTIPAIAADIGIQLGKVLAKGSEGGPKRSDVDRLVELLISLLETPANYETEDTKRHVVRALRRILGGTEPTASFQPFNRCALSPVVRQTALQAMSAVRTGAAF